ncbi:MAG TPA: hypothetical protein VI306_23870 [Pyrinomonadaceae bacterium]
MDTTDFTSVVVQFRATPATPLDFGYHRLYVGGVSVSTYFGTLLDFGYHRLYVGGVSASTYSRDTVGFRIPLTLRQWSFSFDLLPRHRWYFGYHRLYVGGVSASTYSRDTVGILDTTDFTSVEFQLRPNPWLA